jgi:hypothetical protein
MENLFLTEEQIKGLKSYAWEKNHDTDIFFIDGISIECFTDFTGYDLAKLQDLKADNISMGWDLVYGKPGTDEKYPTSYYLQGIVYIDNKIFNDEKHFISDVDFLGLYTKEEEKTEEQLFLDTIAGFIGEHDDEHIIDLLKQNCTDFWNKIVCDVAENLTVTDIDDSLKDDIARDWIEQNSSDAYDTAIDNMDSYEIKDKIMDYLSDNL